MSLRVGIEVSEAHARPRHSLFACGLGRGSQLLFQHLISAIMLPVMMIMDKNSEAVSCPH